MRRRRKYSACGVRKREARSAKDTGGASKVGSTSCPNSSQNRTYLAQAFASFVENRALCFSFHARPFRKSRNRRAGNGRNWDGSDGCSSRPAEARLRSALISGRKRPQV